MVVSGGEGMVESIIEGSRAPGTVLDDSWRIPCWHALLGCLHTMRVQEDEKEGFQGSDSSEAWSMGHGAPIDPVSHACSHGPASRRQPNC